MPGTAAIAVKRFDQPDEVRRFAGHGHADVVEIGGRHVVRSTFEPGWRWSQDVKPIAKTESCQVSHLGYMMSGRMRILMDDGTRHDAGPGDVVTIAPGHDAEIIGDETCVFLDFGDVAGYAKR
jgi:hypothetical protein